MSNQAEKNCRLGVVGGQAVLDGVMMKHEDHIGIAVRRENGEIAVEESTFVSKRQKVKFFNLPIIRGVVNMIEMLSLSVKTLNKSAEMSGIEEELQESKFEKWMKKHFGKGILDIVMFIATILGIALSLFLFVFLPSFLTSLIEDLAGVTLGGWKNIIEGFMKIFIFIGYLCLCLLMKDIRTTFRYHGAEHKTIFCYEAGEELTPENVKKYKRFHPRCGTSFMFVIILISIAIAFLPIFPWENKLLRFAVKLAFLPLLVGLSFEFIRFAGKHDNIFTRILSAPGLWMQRITTKEPTLEQIEVAIHALKCSMPDEFPDYVKPTLTQEAEDSSEVSEETAAEQSEETPVASEETAEPTDSANDAN